MKKSTNKNSVIQMFTSLITGKMNQEDLITMNQVINDYQVESLVETLETLEKKITARSPSDPPIERSPEEKDEARRIINTTEGLPNLMDYIFTLMDTEIGRTENWEITKIQNNLNNIHQASFTLGYIETALALLMDEKKIKKTVEAGRRDLYQVNSLDFLEINKDKNGNLQTFINGERTQKLVPARKRKVYDRKAGISIKEEILQVLREANGPLSSREIRLRTKDRTAATIYTTLWNLKKDNEIHHDKDEATYTLDKWNAPFPNAEEEPAQLERAEQDEAELLGAAQPWKPIVLDPTFPRRGVISILRQAGKPLTQAAIITRAGKIPKMKIRQAIRVLEEEKKIRVLHGKIALNPIMI
tara:strand:- start:955 stop:2028 length:1074 start_codon:yes stop_codon:yes gene_type:complete